MCVDVVDRHLDITIAGADASLGGSDLGEPRYKGQPVIIVHGITNRITRFNVSSE